MNIYEMLSEAINLYNENRYKEAVTLFKTLAKLNNDMAQCMLGICYENGDGVDKDLTKAVDFYRKAAKQKNAEAQYFLGDCLFDGRGVKQNRAKAFKLWKKAADQGCAVAQNDIGYCYREGIVVKQDYIKAIEWFGKAAGQGFQKARENLDNFLSKIPNKFNLTYDEETNKIFSRAMAFYIDENYDEAFPLFKSLAEQGHAEAQMYLGTCYDSGWGVKQDRKQTAPWYMKAALQGFAKAQYKLSICYTNGVCGVDADVEQRNYWSAKAAEQGYTSKQYHKEAVEMWALENAARSIRYRKELSRLNLSTIEDLENLVKPAIKDTTKLIIKRQKKEPEDSYLRSHFGGQPYFEKGEKWPSTKEEDQFELIFQIFNTGNINLPENIKLIQFYYDYENSPISYRTYTDDYIYLGHKHGDGWFIKIYEALNTSNSCTLEKPDWCDTDLYCEIEYEAIKTLPYWNDYDKTVEMLSYMLDGDESYETVAEKLSCNQEFCSQLGGYPHWLQGDGTPDDKDFQLLFQLDSEDEAGLHWVDCGLVYVFYNPKTKETYFEIQFC